MRYVAAYLLAVQGGNDAPSEADIKAILSSAGIDADADKLSKVCLLPRPYACPPGTPLLAVPEALCSSGCLSPQARRFQCDHLPPSFMQRDFPPTFALYRFRHTPCPVSQGTLLTTHEALSGVVLMSPTFPALLPALIVCA